jgi:hypothetical protein
MAMSTTQHDTVGNFLVLETPTKKLETKKEIPTCTYDRYFYNPVTRGRMNKQK